MAPPLIPTTRLSQCHACSEHVKRAEELCPHCGAALADTRASGAAAVLMGLALTGCPDKGPDTTSATTDPTEATAVTEDEPMTSFEAEYGVGSFEGYTESGTGVVTDTSGAMTEATSGETGTTSPETTSPTGAESDYGTAAL